MTVANKKDNTNELVCFRPRKRCENMVKCRDKLLYVKEEHEFGLIPQPLHIGQYYVRLVKDFQLPYDIWWQHLHNQVCLINVLNTFSV